MSTLSHCKEAGSQGVETWTRNFDGGGRGQGAGRAKGVYVCVDRHACVVCVYTQVITQLEAM